MSTQITRSRRCSFDDFVARVGEGDKADLLDGVIYMASPENVDHNDLVGWLYALLRLFVSRHDLGSVFVNRVAFRLSEQNAPEPDVSFVSKRRLDILDRGFVDGPPDLAVEIVSPESSQRDRELKRFVYEEAGVREYWILDHEDRTTSFLGLQRAAFRDLRVESNVFRSVVLPGFCLDVRWLWRRPLPDLVRTLAAIRKLSKP